MKFGICIPNQWGVEDVGEVFRVATRAEGLGFDSLWVSEHVFNVSYVFDRISDRPYYEPLSILSYVAAITSEVRLGTSVLVLPYHNPIRLAKTAATLDVMSKGRLTLGVGVGVIEEELNAMGSTFAERGAISDEAIGIMTELWTQEKPSYQGRYHSFSGMTFSPKPLQKPHIPILIGGNSRSAILRAVRAGNGWHPSSQSPKELGPRIQYLHQIAGAAGRHPAEIPISVRLDLGAQGNATGRAYSLSTSPEELLPQLEAFQNLGVDEVVVSPNTGDQEDILTAMGTLARTAFPAFR